MEYFRWKHRRKTRGGRRILLRQRYPGIRSEADLSYGLAVTCFYDFEALQPPNVGGLQAEREWRWINNAASGTNLSDKHTEENGGRTNNLLSAKGAVMTIILICVAAAGAVLGLRHFKVWALAPLIVFAASIVVVNGIATGLDRRNIMIGVLAAVACPQIGYLMSFARSLVTSQDQLRPDRKSGLTIRSREQDLFASN